jgi:hypothetical protein
VVDLVAEALDGDPASAGGSVVAPLVPFQDPRLAGLQRRSFKTELLGAMQRATDGRFEDLRYRPSWLNPADFERFATTSGLRVVPRALEGFEGLTAFLRFMGACEATLEDLIEPTEVDARWRLWPVDGEPVALEEARRAAKPLDQGFTDVVSERVGVGSELRRLVTSLLDPATASRMVPDRPEAESRQPRPASGDLQQSVSSPGVPPRRLSLKRWRSAEQQVLSLLELQGWDVRDVSRQNVGYDIEGVTPEGVEAFIEVKAIDHPGQLFTLTSNEEATARQKGAAYRLAIVRQAGADLEVAFIPEPANRLQLTRQCRQWVWECSSYEYDPERFLLE